MKRYRLTSAMHIHTQEDPHGVWCYATDAERRIKHLESLMREAIENCEQCRGAAECARCKTFAAELDWKPVTIPPGLA